ncbi:hypothetical protein DMENIID0001_081260 [Sergentomyia squamirostris]
MDQEVKYLTYLEFGAPGDVVKVEKSNISHQLQENEIFLKILASPVNPADLITITGNYAIKPLLPSVPGNECVAQVLGIGTGVKNLSIGDHVVPFRSGLGTWRSHGVFSETDWYRVPENLGTVEAATLTVNPTTAYRMLKDFVNLKAGDTVLQNGANSAVGQIVAQMCKKWGINCVGVVRSRPDIDDLRDMLKNQGAKEIFTEEEILTTDIFSSDILSAPRLALNCVGGGSAESLLPHVAHGGTFVTYGCISKQPTTILASVFIYRDIKCVGFWRTNWTRENHGNPERMTMLKEIIAMYEAGDLHIPDVEYIKIEDYQVAFQGVRGKKCILTYD